MRDFYETETSMLGTGSGVENNPIGSLRIYNFAECVCALGSAQWVCASACFMSFYRESEHTNAYNLSIDTDILIYTKHKLITPPPYCAADSVSFQMPISTSGTICPS